MLNLQKIDTQNEYNFQNIPIYYPYPIYPSQAQLINSIIKALKSDYNGLFQSPTGTGKTLCFLISVLSYINENPNEKIKFIYCTRTHSQMNSVIKELNKTIYQPKVSLMGSRNIFCLESSLKNLSNDAKTIACSEIKKDCFFFKGLETQTKKFESKIMDIEDLVKEGEENVFCPYYFCKNQQKQAELIVLTYNYVLNTKIRKISSLEIKNAVILFDEAHNIEEICENMLGFSFKLNWLDIIKEKIQLVYNLSKNLEYLRKLDLVFLEIDQFRNKFENVLGNHNLLSFRDDKLGNIIKDIFPQSFSILNDDEFLECCKDKNKKMKKMKKIEKFKQILWKINFLQNKFLKNSDKTLDFCWCLERNLKYMKISQFLFDPSIIFSKLMKESPKNIFLCSGTLAPFDSYKSRMGIKFQITESISHPINSKSNVIASILPNSINKMTLDFSKKSREGKFGIQMAIELGESILQLIKNIPNGKLVFFPSFSYMTKLLLLWKSHLGNQLFERFEEITNIFIEEKTRNKKRKKKNQEENYQSNEEENQNSKMNFYKKFFDEAQAEKGAILFGVLRGKGSEGIDFTDKTARAVFIVGIPYLPYKELKVDLKMKYLDKKRSKDSNAISGEFWYQLEAIKSVNQGIGRVIRHKEDYGAIVLMDSRYGTNMPTTHISEWAKCVLQKVEFLDLEKNLNKFFEEKNTSLNDLIK